MSESLAEAYHKEQARLRELVEQYRVIGVAENLGRAMIENILREADEAAMSGDVVRKMQAYNAMKGCE